MGDEFRMGCIDGGCTGPGDPAYPSHKVILTGFYLQETEVTGEELNHFHKAKDGNKLANHPASAISHEEAEEFAASYANGELPTEAQWEFAARSRSADKNIYPWSWRAEAEQAELKEKPLNQLGNIHHSHKSSTQTSPVGSFRGTDATEQGILDLAGNVREWCRDVYAVYAEDEPGIPVPINPEGPKRSPDRPEMFVIRGGSFATTDRAKVQTTFRDRAARGQQLEDVGFRVVLETPDSPGPSLDKP